MRGLYAILDENNFNFDNLKNYIENMIQYNIKIFQIRIKSSFSEKKIKIIESAKLLCKSNNCILLLNDNVKLAHDLDLDGVHIGEKDMDIFKAKSILGDKKIVGISCYNNIKNALHAEKHGATYVSFGAVYKTTTKTNALTLNVSTFKKAKDILNIPICLIGGINTNNVQDVIKLNCDLIAISKGLSSKDDVEDISKIYYEKNKTI
jgi:thiamine-phosphate pyrophosphorylase